MTQTTELYFLTVLEASKTKVPANSISSEGSSPGLQMTTFSLYFYMAEMEIQRGTETASSGVSSYDGTNPIRSGFPLMTSFNLITSLL